MQKHKLIELQKMVEEKIGTLKEEVEIGTNVKLNPLYIADCRDVYLQAADQDIPLVAEIDPVKKAITSIQVDENY
ncbi:MAG TPA: hypothetical protein VE544_01825 [Nitrososphaeraceae archaeon]|nr:hypothetical protein [Nitrososphaeraceae archaeon]